MTVRERVRRVQLGLEIVAVLSALLWGVVVAVTALAIAAGIKALIGMAPEPKWIVVALAVLPGVGSVALLLWRSRFAWAFDRVALWIEERAPELRYSVVTAADARYASSLADLAEPMLERANADVYVRRAAVRALAPAVASVVLALAFTRLLPAEWKVSPAGVGEVSFRNATAGALLGGSRLVSITARVVPPPYAKLRTEILREPSTIAGLEGGRVVLEGVGSSAGVTAAIRYADGRRAALPVNGAGERWTISLTLADTIPALLELADREFRRSIVLDPHADAPPSVKLRLPARDTVLRTASGTLELSADVSDDIGLDVGRFEYIISSGSEETFSFKQGTIGAARFGGRRSGSLAVAVPLSFFELGEGDRLSIRAVAADQNSLTGPGIGFSETRTIRIARKDEYDSLSVGAAAPSGDTAMLSLRMLIVETERLETERARIARDKLVSRSRDLARQTDRVQDEVLPLFKEEGTDAPQVTMDTESTERPVPVSSVLRQAVDALSQASRDLDVADTHSALPELYKAYQALQSLRNFKRYFLRGATRPIIVDIQRVRLTGKTKGSATPMAARNALLSDRDRMRAEYSAAIGQIRIAPGKAVTMLTMIRVESLKKYPVLSGALEDALSAIGRGEDATTPLLKVRRLLERTPVTTDSLPVWGSGW